MDATVARPVFEGVRGGRNSNRRGMPFGLRLGLHPPRPSKFSARSLIEARALGPGGRIAAPGPSVSVSARSCAVSASAGIARPLIGIVRLFSFPRGFRRAARFPHKRDEDCRLRVRSLILAFPNLQPSLAPFVLAQPPLFLLLRSHLRPERRWCFPSPPSAEP
jgi:hypothetical protein